MKVTKERLDKFFDTVEEWNPRYFALVFSLPNHEEYELIVNPRANLTEKRNYIEKNYDKNCVLLANLDVKIVGFVMGDSLAEIEEKMGEI